MKPMYYVIVAGVVVLLLLFATQTCEKKKEVAIPRGEQMYTNRKNEMAVREYERMRRELDSTAAQLVKARQDVDTVLVPVREKDIRYERIYVKTPTLPNADNALRAKSERIALLEKKDSLNGRSLENKDRTILALGNLKGSLETTNRELNGTLDRTLADLEKRNRKKYTVSLGVGGVVGSDLRVRPGASLTVGRRLFDF